MAWPESRVLSPGEVPEEIEKPREEEWAENLNVHLVCPECKEFPPNLVEEAAAGDTICASCGLVLSARIVDTRSEWRTFSNDDQGNDDPSRVGDAANPLLNGSQLQTSIAFGDGSARSRELHRAQNKVTHDKTTKSLLAAYKQIGAYCDASHLPHTVSDTAKQFYKLAEESRVLKGKSQEAIIASCIFVSCRQNGVPRTFKEVMSLTKVPKKEIGRTFKLLEKFLQQHSKATPTSVQGGVIVQNAKYTATNATKAHELCRRYCNHLGLDNATTIVAQEMADQMVAKGWLIEGDGPDFVVMCAP